MKIIVCIKQVPGSTEVKIDPETNTLIREGIENIINPFDTYAVEEGVRVKERLTSDNNNNSGEGVEVISISMGPPQAIEVLRESISVGVDRAILISDRAFAGADTLATSHTLARAIEKIGDYSLIICGKQSLDGDTGQVGPELAQRLGVPFIGYVSAILEIDRKRMKIKRLMDDRYEIYETKLPCVISVVKDINIPRVPSLRGKLKAKNAEIPVWNRDYLELDSKEVGLEGSATQVVKVFTPEVKHDVRILDGSVEEQVEELYKCLKNLNVV
ncbi:MAG: electron transfer flavoprotein subunit beta/FixA family protein [Actinobacteria bacterium]|nr:electron transfer flavoprotein subunit beta/FixA family protein [Actinomycetota bacterium]